VGLVEFHAVSLFLRQSLDETDASSGHLFDLH
jgi:hypothetical protein